MTPATRSSRKGGAQRRKAAKLVRKAKPKRRPKAAGALLRERRELDQALRFFRRQTELAEEAGKARDALIALAWEQLGEAPPIRVRFATELLSLSDQTIVDWTRRGFLEQQDSHPRRISLVSVLNLKRSLDEIRDAGQDRDLASALLNRIELGELQESKHFRTSLEQARRGERGEWPKGL